MSRSGEHHLSAVTDEDRAEVQWRREEYRRVLELQARNRHRSWGAG